MKGVDDMTKEDMCSLLDQERLSRINMEDATMEKEQFEDLGDLREIHD